MMQPNMGKKIKIMTVDDDPDIVKMIKTALEYYGNYEVVEALSGEDCLKKLQEDEIKPALILLDIMMPEVSGADVCRKIKEDSDLMDIKVVMLTSKSQRRDVEEALQWGADGYIIKPFIPEELIDEVKEILDR